LNHLNAQSIFGLGLAMAVLKDTDFQAFTNTISTAQKGCQIAIGTKLILLKVFNPNEWNPPKNYCRLIHGHLISWVFHDIHLNDVVGIVKETAAIGRKMTQVNFLVDFGITFGDLTDRIDGTHIGNLAFLEVN